MLRAVLFFIGLALAQTGQGQVVLGAWDMNGLAGGANNFGTSPYNPGTTASNVTVGGLTRGSGVGTTGTAAARAWGGVNWNSTEAGGISGNQFFTFTIKANTGYTLSLSSINPFDYRRSGTGPGSGTLQYSINGGTYTLITSLSFSSTSSSGASIGSTSLSGIPALQNLPASSTVTFRIIPYGASASTGTFYIFDVGNSTGNDFAVNGTVSPVITFTATPTNTCPGADNGQIAVTGISGGTGPYMYSKDNGANYQSGATFTGLPANTYNVVVKDANGFTSTAVPTIVGTFTAPSCTVAGPDYVCNNATDIVYSAPGGMSAYSWGISANGSIPGSTTGSSVSVTSGSFLSDYTVSVTVTDANGCTSSCSKQSFIYLFNPPANITVTPDPVCLGASLDLSVAAAASSTVSWTGEGVVNPNGNPSTSAVPTTSGPHTYGVTVTTDYGCSNTGTASVTVYPAPPACSISGPLSACANSTGNVYSAPGGLSAYSWGVSGGTIEGSNTGSSVTITAGASGAYTVSVTLSDANGCTSTCSQPVTINPLPTGMIIGPPPSPGPNNDTLCTSLQYGFTGPAGMSAHKWWVTPNATIDGSATGSSILVTVNSGLFLYVRDTITDANGCTNVLLLNRPVQAAPTCSLSGPPTVCIGSTGNVYTVSSNAGTLGYYIWSISGDGMITTPTIGYNVTSVTVTAGASGTYTVTAAIKFDFNTCLKTCSQTVAVQSCAIDFSGKIIWEHDDVSGVKDATVKLTGSATGTATTDINGNFTINTLLTSGSFTLKPTKNLNKFNGVNAGDATAIQQHVANTNIITDPYKLVCADVNKSNSITTLDASLITQALANNPQANAIFNTSWRFVPSNYALSNPPWGFPEQRTYTAIMGAQTNQNFIGMKIGDVTGDATPANFGAGTPMVLRTDEQILSAGQPLAVEVRADRLDDVAAFQFGLRFDPAQLQFVAVEPLAALPLTKDNFSTYDVADGEIRAVWAQAAGLRLDETAAVFRLRFNALQSGTKLSDALYLDPEAQNLPPMAFTSKLAASTVELVYSAATGTNDPAAASALRLEVRPNPFRDATTVSFVLPEACDAQLRVLDVNGRELLRTSKAYPAGANSEMLRLERTATAGVLTCELVTPFGVATRKMILAR